MYTALVIFAQFLFSLSDLWKKMIMHERPFHWNLLGNWQFLAALVLPIVPLGIYLFALSRYDLSRAAVTLGVSAVLFSALFGIWFLGEKTSAPHLLGVLFAVFAIILINWK